MLTSVVLLAGAASVPATAAQAEPAAAPRSTNGGDYVTAESARIRTSPSTNATVLGLAHRGDPVTVHHSHISGEGGFWAEITANDTRGFVRQDLIHIDGGLAMCPLGHEGC